MASLFIKIQKIVFLRIMYRRPSLFADFLSANSLIHISKLVKNGNFLVKNGLFICKFKICGPKWRDVSTTNNEGNLYYTTIEDYYYKLRENGKLGQMWNIFESWIWHISLPNGKMVLKLITKCSFFVIHDRKIILYYYILYIYYIYYI